MKTIYLGMMVCLEDGNTCRVMDVLLDAHEGTPRFLVLDAHGFFGPDVLVPMSAVWRVDDNVHVSLTCQDLAHLPRVAREATKSSDGLISKAERQHSHHGQYAHTNLPH